MSNTQNPYDIFKPVSFYKFFLDVEAHSIDTHLNSFITYISDSWINILHLQSELKKSHQEESKKYNGEDLHEWYEEQYHKYEHFHPNQFMNSTLFSLCSFLEVSIKKLCNKIQEENAYRIKPNDLKGGSDLDSFKKYFELVAEIDLSDLDPKWKKIQFHQKLRNKIVHDGCNIWKDMKTPLKGQELYKDIKANPNLELNQEGSFIIKDRNFLFDYCELIRDYLLSLIAKMAKAVL